MKNMRLLSIAFSLFVVAGVSGGTAYAESDDMEIDDILEDYCKMTDDQKSKLFSEHPDLAQYEQNLASICAIGDEDERKDALEEFIDTVIPETRDGTKDSSKDDEKDDDQDRMHDNLDDQLEYFCEMSGDERDAFFADHPQVAKFDDKLTEFCAIEDEDEREDAIEAFINEFVPEARDEHDMMNEFQDEHHMMVREMQEKHKDAKDKHEYERFCKMSEEERTAAIDDPEKLAKVSEWCSMTPEERDAYKKEHHDIAMDFQDEHHGALERMKANKELSPRLRDMIMGTDVSDIDEKTWEKYTEHGKDHEKKVMKLKEKFHDTRSEMRFRFSDLTNDEKSDIKQRYDDMRAFKSEILQNPDLTDEQKQELRAEFIEDAKDMQLAWVTPRHQVSAGIEPDMVECREGFSLVIKNSNGLPMCVMADTAVKMVEKGYAVPAS